MHYRKLLNFQRPGLMEEVFFLSDLPYLLSALGCCKLVVELLSVKVCIAFIVIFVVPSKILLV
jgi:hypothetical protein